MEPSAGEAVLVTDEAVSAAAAAALLGSSDRYFSNEVPLKTCLQEEEGEKGEELTS